jgi:S-formylglutathione hydrolase FrmB
LNTRYTTVTKLMKEGSEFSKLWVAKDTPQFILVQLDGAGPLGDPYYINSANNGPYGDALVTELLPYIEKQFGTKYYTHKRVVSGVSTGGWVSLGLQVFYPDAFQGAWAACPDPIDFRALQQINIYSEQNAYVDKSGAELGSDRDKNGSVLLTVREECAAERLLGFGNNFAYSGEQWGEWTAAFSTRSPSGAPRLLWDPDTGQLDRSVAKSWEKFDLRLVLERNWAELAPKLGGKLHISAGEADRFYLNKSVHLFDEALSHRSPPLDAEIVYGPGKGHGWSHLSTAEMLRAMQKSINQ